MKIKYPIICSLVLIFFLLSANFVIAHTEEHFAKAEEIIKNKTSCDELTDEQLELLGDYYMEQMHPGEAHELMHQMMGGEDSETTRAMHIQMAKAIYCGETNSNMMSMMNMMGGNMMTGGVMSGNMMTGGVMDNNMMNYRNAYGNNIFGSVFGWIIAVLVLAILTLVIALLIKQLTKKGK